MFQNKIVESLPNKELTKDVVNQLEEHDRIDRAESELLSDGTSYADGTWREDMVEAFWISIDGTAHILQFDNGEWVHCGKFTPSEYDDREIHQLVFAKIDY